ncbi:MAG: thiamine-phosphate pyrophosphorylase [Gammaproteobacteria bacterium]|nr:thiamine-phosphate pyrophosphorylase [Gammaproteobacteria bacterium]
MDANYNRAKEGLRVLEDIARFILGSNKLTHAFKDVRHQLTNLLGTNSKTNFFALLNKRDAKTDVGKKIVGFELKRKNISDIFFANIQRVKESLRTLEEFSKLTNKHAAIKLKSLRYKMYTLEKHASKKIKIICPN